MVEDTAYGGQRQTLQRRRQLLALAHLAGPIWDTI